MKLHSVLMIAALCTGLATASERPMQHFGGAITLEQPVPVAQAVERVGQLQGEILIEGRVSKACGAKGCWMMLEGGGRSVRVTFKDYGFFVPRAIIGKRVLAQGVLSEAVMQVSEARHFARDAGKSDAEIQQIQHQSKEYRFVATAVKILP